MTADRDKQATGSTMIRSQQRLPDSGLRDNHMQWDFRTCRACSGT
jgi:hypothetical protein